MTKTCGECWHCSPETPWKGYCNKWYIATEYGDGPCKAWKEASERRKKDIAKMQNWLKDNGYVEVTNE